MPLFLITSVCDEGLSDTSFRVVEAGSRLAVAQDILQNAAKWENMLWNTRFWREYRSVSRYEEPRRWSAADLLVQIDRSHVDGDSENQFRIQEIVNIERIGEPVSADEPKVLEKRRGIAMAYSDFELKTAVHSFGLTEARDMDLFGEVAPLEPGEFLKVWLEKFAPVALGVNSEKARSEFIIAPMLAEMKLSVGAAVNVLPGVTFDVDKAQGLSGYCDFLIARSPEIFYVQGPVLAVVEAKREDLVAGLGQCAAAMVAVQLFNQREGTALPAVFGCVTSGSNWRFLKLQGTTLWIDRPEYYLGDAAKILGILVSIARG